MKTIITILLAVFLLTVGCTTKNVHAGFLQEMAEESPKILKEARENPEFREAIIKKNFAPETKLRALTAPGKIVIQPNGLTDALVFNVGSTSDLATVAGQISEAKTLGYKVIILTEFLLFDVISGNITTPDCNFYGATMTKPFGHRTLKSNWQSLGVQMLNYDPVFHQVDIYYLVDEANLSCTNPVSIEAIASAFDLFGLDTSAGYAIQERGVGAYIPNSIDIPTFWNYGDFDPAVPFPLDDLSFSDVSLDDYVTQINSRPVAWVIPNFCEPWRHINKYGWLPSCANPEPLAEPTFNQFDWAIDHSSIEIIYVFGNLGGYNGRLVDRMVELVIQ